MRGAMKRLSYRFFLIGAVVGAFLVSALPAWAQSPTQPPPEILPEIIREKPAPPAAPAPEAAVAFTGAELALLIAVFGGLLVLGTWLYLAGRRRARASATA
jgi:hypothetical protein